ncbi:hypothetical protein Psch_02413 [Pelotomaculum schinkii]|uniref:Uncharacterized protein n=1 Tax=Pelotomaculum schinkii TaxID=78350 RepID=A0A4Y7R9B4_9FIRM|nr:hypothetical protein [Pelotomaculum schinkii]TEB05372.1 hypothetical protein Psch_02413 [Pelotomaculum schinkii]
MKKYVLLLLVLAFCVTMPTAVFAASDNPSQVIILDERYNALPEHEKSFVDKIVKAHENSKSLEDYQKELNSIGMEVEKTYVKEIKIIKDSQGKQIPVVISNKEYSGFYNPDKNTDDIIIMGGTKSDLTLSAVVSRTQSGDSGYIDVDYYFNWSNCEEIDGSDDGWAVNWQTDAVYAVARGHDSDLTRVKTVTGGMGVTTDDDNSRGWAWVTLRPLDGGSPFDAHGELVQEYCHTYGFNCPPVSFSVSSGFVSVGVEVDPLNERHWVEEEEDFF